MIGQWWAFAGKKNSVLPKKKKKKKLSKGCQAKLEF
jgi:hypothetical protein